MFGQFREKLRAWNDLSLFFTLIGASMNGRTNVARKVLGRGTNVNVSKDGITPLLAAVKYDGDVETIRLLLAQGANVNAKDKKGKTAIVIARQKDRSDLVEILEAASAPQ